MTDHRSRSFRTPRTRRRMALLAAAGAIAISGACGGGGDKAVSAPASAAPSPAAAPADALDPGGASPVGAAASVPDACTLLDPSEVQAAFGVDPGVAETQGDPRIRTICLYRGGVIVAAAKNSYYEMSIGMAVTNGQCRDVAGIGERAKFCVVHDTVGQLYWLDGGLMYDITGPTADEAPYTKLARAVGG